MIRSIYTAATGMEAQQLYMDTISNNLANVNTTGFKRVKAEFQDLMYQTLREPGARNPEGGMAPAGIEVGLGVRPGATQRIYEQGSLSQSGNPMDIAIQGTGFFQVAMPDGGTAYKRDGSFKLSADGTIVTSDGFFLEPQITVPEGGQELSIDPRGRVTCVLPGETESTEIGQMELARFVNPGGLSALGNNLFVATDSSGQPMVGLPAEAGMGSLAQGYTETSNVQMVEEMVSMITAQRAYEISSKSIQVGEEMLQTATNLKR
jgi:flagellar basal-body rod protein FlgG